MSWSWVAARQRWRPRKPPQTIPIVMVAGVDPVGVGLAASLSRPGGNVTGLSASNEELSSKRVQLLKEFVPLLTRVAVLTNPLQIGHPIFWPDTEAAARKLGLDLQPLEHARSAGTTTSSRHSRQQD